MWSVIWLRMLPPDDLADLLQQLQSGRRAEYFALLGEASFRRQLEREH